MLPLFERFLKERKYLKNVSEATLEWHSQSLAWLGIERPTEGELRRLVVRMREAGLRASSCNCRIRSINAYLNWSGSSHRVSKLKEDEYTPSVYSHQQVALLHKWKPSSFSQQRLHALVMTLFDTGVRLNEALTLRVENCDLDNLLLTVTGKGRKQRVIPFSFELRRLLAKFILDWRPRRQEFVFATRDGRKLGERDVLRDVKLLCRKLGFEAPRRSIHAMRHTFGTEYVRRGGSVFHLQRTLGHATLEMSRRYANLTTEDLQAVHEGLTLLAVR